MRQHPLDTGICPVTGEKLEKSPAWEFQRDDELHIDCGATSSGLLIVRTRGKRTTNDLLKLSDLLDQIREEMGLSLKPWVLIEDFSFLIDGDLETRQTYLEIFYKQKELRGVTFCGVQGQSIISIRLGITFYRTNCEIDVVPTIDDAFIQGLNWLGHSVPHSQVNEDLIAMEPKKINDIGDLVEILGSIHWGKPGLTELSFVPEKCPWKPVAETLALVKRDLDQLIERRKNRLLELQEKSRENHALLDKFQTALAESRRIRDQVAQECMLNLKLTRAMIENQDEIVFAMGEIIESRSRETANHLRRVSEYSYLLAKKHGLPERECFYLLRGSPLHDAGKIAIPDAILNKPGKLTPEEFEIMKTHASKGWELLNSSSNEKHSHSEILSNSAIIALQHHEKWNGKGYPQGLSGNKIHIYGRITALADVFDALASNRCYKKAWPLDQILDLIRKEKGEQFDPHFVDIFFDNLNDFVRIRERYPDAAPN